MSNKTNTIKVIKRKLAAVDLIKSGISVKSVSNLCNKTEEKINNWVNSECLLQYRLRNLDNSQVDDTCNKNKNISPNVSKNDFDKNNSKSEKICKIFHFINDDKLKAIQMHECGQNLKAIAKQFNTTGSTIARWIKNKNQIIEHEKNLLEVKMLYENGETVSNIARKFNVPNYTALKWIKDKQSVNESSLSNITKITETSNQTYKVNNEKAVDKINFDFQKAQIKLAHNNAFKEFSTDITFSEKLEAIKRYENGELLIDIAQMLNCQQKTIVSYIKTKKTVISKLKCERKSNEYNGKNDNIKKSLRVQLEVVMMHENGETVENIASLLNVKIEIIKNWIDSNINVIRKFNKAL